MRGKRNAWDWDFSGKNYGKPYGCKVCEHNPMGICETVGKEVPIVFVSSNGSPVWCPLKKKGKRK